MRALFVAADIHGHRVELRRELQAAGLVDTAGDWSGDNAVLWFLGDYIDRGPDGIGVIDDIRRLAAQATDAGGEVNCLLGNHELQLLGADRFGTTTIRGREEPDGLLGLWRRWGGVDRDLERLTDEHRVWLRSLPAVALADGNLLLHADNVNYLDFGATVETINAGVTAEMATDDPAAWLDLVFRLADRLDFLGGDADRAVDTMLDTVGGERIVHGHSTLISHFGVAPRDVQSPIVYGGGRVIAVDGGAYQGGRILVARVDTLVHT